MSTLVAVQGCTFKYETIPHGTATLVVEVVPASGKASSGGNKAHTEKITINVISGSVSLDAPPEGASSGQGTVPPGTIVIDATTQKASSETLKFVLKGDSGQNVFSCIFPSSSAPPPTISSPVTIKAMVDDPGQNVLKVT